MNEKIIKKTQDSLGKIIKKPPLTEKLLNKPPFRFLHDVMTSVIKSTGFMKGLFADGELNSENVKDKDSKVAFLQKAIDMVSLVIGKPISARPSKIVAGHEPEKTNEFLQALAEAINKKVDNEDYVKRVLQNDKPGSGKKPPSGSGKKEREPSSDRRKRREDRDKEKPPLKPPPKKSELPRPKKREDGKEKRDDKEKKHRSRDKEDKKDREKSRDRERSKDRKRDRDDEEKDKKRHRDKDKDKDRGRDRDRDRDRSHDKGSDREKDRERRRHKREKDNEEKEEKEAEPAVNHDQEEDVPARVPRPTSAKGSRRRHRDDEEELKKEPPTTMNGTIGEDDLPPQVAAARKLARPSSARPAPPRVKKNEPLPQEMHIGSGAPHVITDKDDDSDEDETFITKEEEPVVEEPPPPPAGADEDEEGEHGGLVKKILQTKTELEGGSQQTQNKPMKKTEIERSHVNDAARRKEREMVQKDIDKLRGSIQTLTRSVNPLGKIMDFIQEDLDSMQKELEMWKREHKQNTLALQQEQSITETSVEPLRAQLVELDQQIADQLDLIAAVKSNVMQNDERIQKMLGSITKS